jgi:hypothetical protein
VPLCLSPQGRYEDIFPSGAGAGAGKPAAIGSGKPGAEEEAEAEGGWGRPCAPYFRGGCVLLPAVRGQAPGAGVPHGPAGSARDYGAPGTALEARAAGSGPGALPRARGVEPRAAGAKARKPAAASHRGGQPEQGCPRGPHGRYTGPAHRPGDILQQPSCPAVRRAAPRNRAPIPPILRSSLAAATGARLCSVAGAPGL